MAAHGSIGLAPVRDREASATATPASATPAPAPLSTAPARPRGTSLRTRVPQLIGGGATDTLGAIGLLLSQTAAGIRGQETPLQKIRKQQALEERNALLTLNASVDLITKGLSTISSASAAQRPGVVNAFKELAGQSGILDPSVFDDMGKLTALSGSASLLQGLNATEQDVALSFAGGTRDGLMEVVTDADFMRRLEASTDFTNKPIVSQKLSQMISSLPPELRQAITDPATGRIDMTMAQLQSLNAAVQKVNPDDAFTNGELGTIGRNLEELGFITPEQRAKRVEILTGQALGESDPVAAAFRARETALATGDKALAKTLTKRIDKLLQDESAGQALVAIGPNGEKFPAAFDTRDKTFSFDRGNGMEPMPSTFTPVRISVQATNVGDVAGVAGSKAAAKSIGKARTNAIDAASGIQAQTTTLGNLLADVRKLPSGTTGVLGNVTNAFGGYLGQIDKQLGEDFVQLMTGGATRQEFDAFRIRARSAIAASVGEVVGEESGRITKEELAITEQALKLFEANASKDQIENVLQQLVIQKVVQADFLLSRAGQAQFPVFRGQEGAKEAVREFITTRLIPLGVDADGQKKIIELIRQNRRVASGIVSAEDALMKK